MNKREKAAKEELAKKRYDGGRTAFHVTKKGASDVDSRTDDGTQKIGVFRSIKDSAAELRSKKRR